MTTRIEKDSMGELEVPATALYAAQTQRAINNFPVSGQGMPTAFIRALLQAKAAAAQAKLAYRENRPILDVAAEQTDLSRDELAKLLDPVKLTEGGI